MDCQNPLLTGSGVGITIGWSEGVGVILGEGVGVGVILFGSLFLSGLLKVSTFFLLPLLYSDV